MKRFLLSFIMAMLIACNCYAESTNVQKVFKDDFPGTALVASKWETPVIAGSATYAVASSNLTVTLTAGATDSFTLTSKDPISLPNRVSFGLTLSARNTNQETLLRIISQEYKDSGGTSGHMAQWKFNGVTNTTAYTQTVNSGTAGTDTSRASLTASSTACLYQIMLGIDDVRFTQTTLDNAGGKVGVFVHTSKLPDPSNPYYIQVIVRNTGASSALTATLDFVSGQAIQEMAVEVMAGSGDAASGLALPVNVVQSLAPTNTVTTSTTISDGQTTVDSAITGKPVRVGSVAYTANPAAVHTGDAINNIATLVGVPIYKSFSIPEGDWTYNGAGAVTNTSDVPLKGAAAAGIRNYLTGIQIQNTNATATEVVIKDGSTVIWRGYAAASMTGIHSILFETPLRTTAATALNFACITTGSNTYVNAQGYQAP